MIKYKIVIGSFSTSEVTNRDIVLPYDEGDELLDLCIWKVRDDIELWCKEGGIRPPAIKNFERDGKLDESVLIFRFRSKKAALFFKLRWC